MSYKRAALVLTIMMPFYLLLPVSVHFFLEHKSINYNILEFHIKNYGMLSGKAATPTKTLKKRTQSQ